LVLLHLKKGLCQVTDFAYSFMNSGKN